MFGVGVGIRVGGFTPSSGGGGLNPDAQAFITATGITNPTEISAINTLVNDLQGYGIWSKMKAVYPFVGGTATTHKYNLKDPRDLDAAFRLVFNGGWTHSSNGATPNGTNGWANTYLNANTNLTLSTNHFSYYSRTSSVANVTVEIGVFSITFAHLRAAANYAAGSVSSLAAFSTTATASGFWLGSKTSNNSRKAFYNSSLEATNTTNDTNTYPNLNVYIGARNDNNTAMFFSDKQTAFASIGDGLTDTEAANFYTSVQKYQTTLGRQIGTPIYGGNKLLNLYPLAAAAYSLRLLNDGYTGNAIRVRRSSDNAEQNIGFISGELDTTSLASFCSGTNGFVTTWYDQSGNGNDATQTTAANQPQIVSGGSVILDNGKPTLQFDGTNDSLLSTSAIDPLFLTAVNTPNTTANYKTIFGADTNDAPSLGSIYFQYADPALTPKFSRITITDTQPTFFASRSAVSNNVRNLYTGTRTNTTIQLYINNTIGTSGSTSTALVNVGGVDSGRFRLMAGYFNNLVVDNLQGNLTEFISYTNDQSSNRSAINTNINTYYGIY